MTTVFISSTYQDLKEHREHVWKALRQFDIRIKGMEEFGARKTNALQTCLSEIDESDLFIGIISMAYGSIDQETGKSYTQLEYERAKEKGLDIRIYMIHNKNGIVRTGDIDFGDSQILLSNFKKTLERKHTIGYFEGYKDLSNSIYRMLLDKNIPLFKYLKDRPKELFSKVFRYEGANRKYIIFIGYNEGMPFEIFSTIEDDINGIVLPKSVVEGKIIRRIEMYEDDKEFVKDNKQEEFVAYDFRFTNKRGYKTTIEGLSFYFDPMIGNFDRVITRLLQSRVEIPVVIDAINQIDIDNDDFIGWKNLVISILKKI